MTIRFAADMPPAVVEVVSPDLATVDRLSLEPGQQKEVDVPSEASFLRVHLGSGEVVTLNDPGNLNRTVSLSKLLERRSLPPQSTTSPRVRSSRSRRDLRKLPNAVTRGSEMLGFHPVAASLTQPMLEGGLHVRLEEDPGGLRSGTISDEGTTLVYKPQMSFNRLILTLERMDMTARVRLPGSATEVTVRSDLLDDGHCVVSVRVKTADPTADAIAGYLVRGDLYSASSMSDWASSAEHMVESKTRDPFAACVGAYLLLRVRRLDLLHEWTENLRSLFPWLTDPHVIRAWHLIYARRDEAAIRDLFAQCLGHPLPVFSEGLRLLSDGVRLLGPDADAAIDKLNRHVRRSLSGSPFTTTIVRSEASTAAPFELDVGYASSV
jgi:hypothetical protein